MLTALIYIGGMIGGFVLAKNFVVNRLRFVDAAQSPLFPWIAGFGAALVAWPVTVLLPLVTITGAALFGLGTGLGTRSGARQLKSGL